MDAPSLSVSQVEVPHLTAVIEELPTTSVEKLSTPEPIDQMKSKVVDLTRSVVKVTTAPPSISDARSNTSSEEEKGVVWDGYEDDVLPEKTQGRLLRNIRFQIMSLYRRLFGIVFAANMGVFIWYAVKGVNANQLGKVVIANLFTAILMRQEYVINAFFFVACLPPNT